MLHKTIVTVSVLFLLLPLSSCTLEEDPNLAEDEKMESPAPADQPMVRSELASLSERWYLHACQADPKMILLETTMFKNGQFSILITQEATLRLGIPGPVYTEYCKYIERLNNKESHP